jgi:hypothetical protein
MIAARVCLKAHIWNPHGAVPSVRTVSISRGPGQEEAPPQAEQALASGGGRGSVNTDTIFICVPPAGGSTRLE